jgi:hypothetical protein
MNTEIERTEQYYQIFRFKFTEEFMKELHNFSKIHQHDHRTDFKEAWIKWNDENNEIIQEEEMRLVELGYEGDVQDKMFKSARYYFRKKSVVKIEPKERRQYISLSHVILEAMDTHVKNNCRSIDYQPKTGFISFCKDNEQILKVSINTMIENGISDLKLIECKLKKTYKNRYFMLIMK